MLPWSDLRKQFERCPVKNRNVILDKVIPGFFQYIHEVYTFVQNEVMKTLSLKLDDAVFEETEEVLSELKVARNRYITEALKLYNQYNKRRVLKKKLAKESVLLRQSSAEVLAEFEKLADAI